MGRGDKEAADAAACDAIQGMFDLVAVRGEVLIGEGIKDNAPGIFLGDKLGRWNKDDPRFDIALDPFDGTSNISKGMPNSISVMAAVLVPEGREQSMVNIPSFYVEKLSYGPRVARAVRDSLIPPITLDLPFDHTLSLVSDALGKRLGELVVTVLDRPRNQPFIDSVRRVGASLRLIADGDITAAALKALGGEILVRMWPRDAEERAELLKTHSPQELARVYRTDDLVQGDSAIFCATGISDSPMLPGVKLIGKTAITHSILMRSRSRTVRYIKAIHDLEAKTIRLRSLSGEERL